MTRTFSFMMCGLLAWSATPASAALVDRVAITVGNKVITESEIVRRIRLAAFQNGLQPDYGLAARREAARSLIDLKMVEREMDLGHYPRTEPEREMDLGHYPRTEPERAKTLLAAFTAEHFRSSPEALRMALAGSSLASADLMEELAEQNDLTSFLDLRFRPSVQISDAEIEKYFHENIESKNPVPPVELSDVRTGIEQILAAHRADQDLDAWLQDQKKRTKIVYVVEDLQ